MRTTLFLKLGSHINILQHQKSFFFSVIEIIKVKFVRYIHFPGQSVKTSGNFIARADAVAKCLDIFSGVFNPAEELNRGVWKIIFKRRFLFFYFRMRWKNPKPLWNSIPVYCTADSERVLCSNLSQTTGADHVSGTEQNSRKEIPRSLTRGC